MIGRAAPAAFDPAAIVHTETVDYTYNTDGALTARTTTLDGGAASITYLTWDNFVPTAGAAASGTVSAGNGNLLGYGDTPGSTGLSVQFSFDRRNRLTGYSGGGTAITYDYYANGLLAGATPASGSSLRFYQDAGAHMTNLRQDAGSAAELWSGDLGAARYVSDGSEQVRLMPRKDTACTYDSGDQTVAAYEYDAYGANVSPGATTGTEYDIRDNPMQYAGEYRDALWGGYYLRARWYLPDLPLFLSRDPVAHLGRYGYGGGNPVSNVDPSGRSFKSFLHGREGWQRSLAQLGGGNAWYDHVLRLTTGVLLGPLQIVANPDAFLHSLAHDTGGIDVYLAAGVVGGLALGGAAKAGWAINKARFAMEGLLGIGASASAAASRGFGHFNWNTFADGLEISASPYVLEGLGRAVTAGRVAYDRWSSASRRRPSTPIVNIRPHAVSAPAVLDITKVDDGHLPGVPEETATSAVQTETTKNAAPRDMAVSYIGDDGHEKIVFVSRPGTYSSISTAPEPSSFAPSVGSRASAAGSGDSLDDLLNQVRREEGPDPDDLNLRSHGSMPIFLTEEQ